MAWRYHGRARVNARNPEAFGVCDRCCFWYNLNDLRFQFDWRGNKLQNLYIRVCDRCYDKPFEHYRPIITPPDPVPVKQPRIDQYAVQMPFIVTDTNGREISDTNNIFVTATTQPFPPPLSNAGPYPQVLTTPQAMDRYIITAPDGGPVILIPD